MKPPDTVEPDVLIDAEFNAMNERTFQAWVRRIALENNWLFFHTYDSRKSDKGFPDCVIVRDGFLIFAELKVQSESKGKVTPNQQVWLDALGIVSDESFPGARNGKIYEPVRVFLWRPLDRKQIIEVLT